MRKTMHAAAAFGAAMIAGLALSGCPMQPSYPSTITPIYAATSTGLWVYNGSSWTSYLFAGASAVVVSGSGAGALAYVGNSAGGVSLFSGASRIATKGLTGSNIKRLFSGSSIYAATDVGVSILNSDGLSWTNNSTAAPVNDVFSSGTYTLVASGAGLSEYNNGMAVGSTILPVTIVPLSTTVTAVYVDPLGDIFVGTDRGLAAQYAGTSVWASVLLLPLSTPVNQITTDQSGNIYAATSGGLYVVGTSAVLALPGAVTCVWVDGAGTIYAGTGTPTGLQVSRDGGRTWTTQLSGQSVNSVTTTAPLYSF